MNLFKSPLYLLLVIVVIALVYRAINLGSESIWWDEFSSVIHLSPPSEYLESPHYVRWTQGVHYEPSANIIHFLTKNRTLDPATMPLYYALEYLWHTYVDESMFSLRILSVSIGLLVVFATYGIGASLFNHAVGLWSAFLVALSPIHRQFAQEIRMYGLFTLLSIVSFLYFSEWLKRRERKYFFLYLFEVFLLLWTHPFAVLVPIVQGVYLFYQWILLYLPLMWRNKSLFAVFLGNIRTIVKWGFALFLISIPSIFYIKTIKFWDPELTSTWMKLPTLREFFGDLVADDCIGWTYQLRGEPDLWVKVLGEGWGEWIFSQRYLIGGVLVFVFVFCFIYSVMFYVRFAMESGSRSIPSDESSEKAMFSFLPLLWLWWFLPPIFLYVVSWVWRPCIMPRYTLHSSIAMYLIVGFVMSRLMRERMLLKGVLVMLLIGGYIYQASLLISKPQHTDWRKAGWMIKNNAKSEDIILVNNELWKRVFLYNLGPVPNVVCYGSNFTNTSEIAYFLLSEILPHLKSNSKLWIVVQSDYFESAPLYHFERLLKELNIVYKYREFPGIQRVVVYYDIVLISPKEDRDIKKEKWFYEDFSALALEFWRVQDYYSAIKTCEFITKLNPGYAQAYSYMGMSYKELQMWEEALKNFKMAVSLSPEHYPWNWINIGDILINLGRYEEAIQALQEGIKLLPNDSFAHTCLGKAYAGLGDTNKALEYLRKAIELDPSDMRPVVELQKLESIQKEVEHN